MTSFDFVVSCGGCHPGGGPLEFDRAGKRYDQWMADPVSGYSTGGENGLDGDYYRARWVETGVLEADCLLCHMPAYRMDARRGQIARLNFRWAATAGSGLGEVVGSVRDGDPVVVRYDVDRFLPNGKVGLDMVTEPRNETCLWCHAKPGWKKRGANFRARTDVHLRAGLRCVDCHPAGSQAVDERIRGREVHQFGKGDDPGGHVRDDLDNTCRACADCHSSGYLGAPIAAHAGLPPLHVERIACQTCHIPERLIKAVQFVAGDVLNPGSRIPTKGKHLWTFYGPNLEYWNHYGDLEMMGYDDKPTDAFRPALGRYKGKIYPVNRVHSSWPAIETIGEMALQQPRMRDIYTMWAAHRADSTQFAALAMITDDNADGVIEVNRPAEIDALIEAVTQKLLALGISLEGKHVVWVMNQRVYSSGKDYREIEKESWEASPYGNVHTYNHDVYPARAALGARGCTECHHPNASLFFASVPVLPISADGSAVRVPQSELLGISTSAARLGAWREAYLKWLLYALLLGAGLLLVALAATAFLKGVFWSVGTPAWLHWLPFALVAAVALLFSLSILRPDLAAYLLPYRKAFDGNHFGVGLLVLAMGGIAWILELRRFYARGGRALRPAWQGLRSLSVLLILQLLSGGLMYLGSLLGVAIQLAYTVFDLVLVLLLGRAVLAFARELWKPGGSLSCVPASPTGTEA